VTDAGFSMHAVSCPGCGGPFDAVHLRSCPYCGREYEASDRDWVVTEIYGRKLPGRGSGLTERQTA